MLLVVPCKGAEPGLAENLGAILRQDISNVRYLFVTESDEDSAVPIIDRAIETFGKGERLVAGSAVDEGQKVHNLRFACQNLPNETDIIAFADSDARPSEHWLSDLISPLAEHGVGASSGYRWFVSKSGSPAGMLLAVWNASIASALGADKQGNFCWGGSMAIKREDFDALDVAGRWRGAISDDFMLTESVKDAGNGVHFEPKCLTVSVAETDFESLWEFTRRQMLITRVYSPVHFRISFVGSTLFVLALLAAIAGAVFAPSPHGVIFLSMLAFVLILGSLKSFVRLRAVTGCLPEGAKLFRAQLLPQILLWPFSSILFFLNCVAATLSNRIVWRGIGYELVSKNETILRR
ncbi:MAG: glycosyltransferase family 2 protein [Pyrinomonadaceae bacterium]